jgi:peptidoglycan/LPS O-acetylase OafA/YrhL
LVDSLRAIAVAAVFLFHASHSKWTAQLNVGVTLFFVISAFLLYRPYIAERFQGKPRIGTWSFLQRRILRIVPAYWVALIVIFASTGFSAHAIDGFDHFGLYVLFLQNYSPKTVFGVIPGAWSLCIEASFYLALPAYAAAVRSWARGPAGFGRELRLLAGVALVSLLYRGGMMQVTGVSVFAYATLPATALWFVFGMSAAVISVASEVDPRWRSVKRRILDAPRAAWWGLALAFFVLLNLPFEAGGNFDPIHPGAPDVPLDMLRYVLAGLVAICFFWPAVSNAPRRSRVVSFLALRPLAWVGLISYGIFLWHQRVLDFFKTRSPSEFWAGVFAAVVVIGVAAGSYYVIERRFLRRKPGIRRAANGKQSDHGEQHQPETARVGA